jgi:hypothetical protein
MTEDVNFSDDLDRLSTSFYTQREIYNVKNNDNDSQKQQIKKVKFLKKLTVIPVENYKEYNKSHTYPRKTDSKKTINCQCNVF